MSAETTPAAGPAEIPAGLLLLREEVPAHMVGKLPKVTCPACIKKNCENRSHNKVKCTVCDAFISPQHIHLDFVGHAETTDRLLEADIMWNWEPLAFGSDGLPQFDQNGGLWIRLTVCGVTRLGYGTADNKANGASVGDIKKEIIGDALRNASMRFGHALNLWAKTDIHAMTEQAGDEPVPDKRTQAVRSGGKRRGDHLREVKAGEEDPWADNAPTDAAPRMSVLAQQTALAAALTKKVGIKERDDKLAWLKAGIGRPVASSKELTYKEASDALTHLDSMPDFVPLSEEQTAEIVRDITTQIADATTVAALNSVGRSINAFLQTGRIVGQDRRELIAAWGERNQQLGAEVPQDAPAGVA